MNTLFSHTLFVARGWKRHGWHVKCHRHSYNTVVHCSAWKHRSTDCLFHVGPARTQPDPSPSWQLKGGWLKKGVNRWRSACYQSWVSSLVSVLDSRLSFRLLLWSGGSSGTWARGSERIRYLRETQRAHEGRWSASLVKILPCGSSDVRGISRAAPSSRTLRCRFHTLGATEGTKGLNKQVNCAMHSPLSTANRTQPSPWIPIGASLAQLLCWKSCFSVSAYYFVQKNTMQKWLGLFCTVVLCDFFAAAAADIQLLSQKSTDLLRSEVPRWGGLLHFLCQTCKPGVCWTTFCLHFFKLNIEWTKLQVKKHVRSGRSADSHTFPLRTQPELFYDIGVFFFVLCVNGLLTKWSKGWNEVSGSCKHNVDILSSVTDRSEISQVIRVTGNQKLLGAPVMFSLSWLQSVRWETL